ncbi:hypothetical protein GGX14DRAFT_408286 [Mycena pura]|uniref:Uncharacterized protein n=1 Tax=Mycena pura TaxID=153505 RepID=A0AAD6UTM0_9AGAR|nr:hypothetical protein GGX14DRAFT_408286 [Mycena pura]
MSGYTLDTLDPAGKPEPGTVSSLIFRVPFPEHVPRQLLARYQGLRAERHLESETHLDERAGRLALRAYDDEGIHSDRERWCERAAAAFHDIVQANKQSLRHVELILPTGGMATPLNVFASLKEVAHLESLCVQWPLRGYTPLMQLLMPDWSHVLEDSNIIPSMAQFHDDLMALLGTHARTLKRLRVALPQSTTQRPFSALAISASRFPALPALELLDLTHWSPRIPDVLALLAPGGPLPTLQHLILDQGTEIPLTEDGDDDEEAVVDAVEAPPSSWAALGAHLTTHARALRLRSLSAALQDARGTFHPVSHRLDQAELRGALGLGGDAASLVVCTAWPVQYSALEPVPAEGGVQQQEEDLYAHAPGCGHLAYPEDQRPTTGLWPAEGEEASFMQRLKGAPWY